MKALGGSYLKLSVSRERERVGLDFGLCRHDFGFLVLQKRVGDRLVSLRANYVSSISTAASAQTYLESEEIQTVDTDQPNTVQVRFKLHKQCAFGQQFLVVGDDPSLGSWDPSEGVPLNWSEGHVWTAQVDIPSSKVINYKFILKEITGTVSWQPGPDRVLETWDTANTISVTEDWEIPEFQIIDEEEVVDDVKEACLNGSGPLIAGDLNEIVGEEEGEVMEERDGYGRTSAQTDEPSTLMVAENISVKDLDGSSQLSLKNELMLVVDEGLPALVPGLATTRLDEEVEAEEAEVEANSIIGSITVTEFNLEEVEAEEAKAEASSIIGSITETEVEAEEAKAEASSIIGSITETEVEAEEAKAEASSIIGSMTATESDMEEIEAEEVKAAASSIKVSITATESDLEEVGAEEVQAAASSIIGSITTADSDEMVEFATVFEEIEVSSDPNEKHNSIVDETEAATKPEISASASLHYAETSELMAVEEKPRFGGRKKKMESNILGSNMQWGRQTLYKFLANLGFIQHS